MDITWDKPVREVRNRHRRENPSFSSSLLDAVYRSIDETNVNSTVRDQDHDHDHHRVIFYGESMSTKKQIKISSTGNMKEEEVVKFRRACMIEKWMEKKASEKSELHRNSMADFDRKARNVRDRCHGFNKLTNSSSSSSDSSSAGGFSSSESDSFYGSRSRLSSSTYTMQRPKPIRTSTDNSADRFAEENFPVIQTVQKAPIKKENGSTFLKTKSKALKIYGDLKKVKQPISPGGRLSNFLNSLFNGVSVSPRKQKISKAHVNYDDDNNNNNNTRNKPKSANGSTCSSASSFSRSCLSKTPSTRSIPSCNNGGMSTKRSVRFCPVSVIVDEDCRPCGHKSLHKDEPGLVAITTTTMKNHSSKTLLNFQPDHQEVSRDHLIESYRKNINVQNCSTIDQVSDNEEEEEDAASCSSSDLFELDNLSVIGIERYSEELPVYETSRFDPSVMD